MAFMRRLGRLAGTLLDDQLARGRARDESDLVQQRQKELAHQNLLDHMATTLGPMLAKRQIRMSDLDMTNVPDDMKSMLSIQASAAPSDEEVSAGVLGGVNKDINASKTPEELGSLPGRFEQARTGMHAQNTPIGLNDVSNIASSFNAQADVLGNSAASKQEQGVVDKQSDYDITHPGLETKEVGGFLFEKQPNGVWKKVAEGRAPEGRDTRPYYQLTPTYDAQGRPNGAIRLEGRTGDMVRVGDDQLGGQLRPPPGNLGEQTISNESSLDALDNLETQFNQGAKHLVGPAEGRLRVLGQKIPGVPVNEEFANFEAAEAAFRNSVIKAITGAQMSEPEANRIRQQIPEVTDKAEVWQAKADQTRKNLAFLEARLRQDRGVGTPKAPGPGTPNVGGASSEDLRKKYGY